MTPRQIAISLSHPGVVGTIHCARSLAAARGTSPALCDWFELRVDQFYPELDALENALPDLACPLILTVRHASEGGAAMAAGQRRAAYSRFIKVAGLVDIELRWAGAMAGVIREARAAGAGLILSHHDFHGMPSPRKLAGLARRAREAGADVFKVAAMTRSRRNVQTLLDFLADEKAKMRLAVMGMGRYGRLSRVLLAGAGSCLNYGYLGKPNASGQWPAAKLKAEIAQKRAKNA